MSKATQDQLLKAAKMMYEHIKNPNDYSTEYIISLAQALSQAQIAFAMVEQDED